MKILEKLFAPLFEPHYRRPVGVIGHWVGRQMAADHYPENLWTVERLQARPGDTILEIGFGPGVAIQLLLNRVPQVRVAGVDYSQAMVAAARRRNAAAQREGRLDLRLSRADSLPFSDETFDSAYSIHSIYFWPQPLEVLREVRQVLKPGGKFLITLMPKERMLVDFPGTQEDAADFRLYAGEELVEMFRSAGYREVRIEADPDERKGSSYTVIGVKR